MLVLRRSIRWSQMMLKLRHAVQLSIGIWLPTGGKICPPWCQKSGHVKK